MFINKIIYPLLILFVLPLYSLAQDEIEKYPILNFERNYDSLINSFYIQQNKKVINKTFSRKSDNRHIPTSAKNVEDSIFAIRLRMLPSAFDLTYNDKVRNTIEYYIDRIPDRVSVLLGLSKYYFPIFEEIFDQYSVPHELKYLVVIESALNPNAVSRVGATGLWQFMYSTAKMYDLRINANIDDRKDPIRSSIAAAKYLRDLYKIFGDWELALAAYNCGPGNVNKAIRRSGKNTFWDIYDFLPRETRGYVPAYIAACYVMNYYMEHNIEPAFLTKPFATDTILVKQDIHFEQISSVLNMPFELIADLNPQYKGSKILGTEDEYYIKLPINRVQDFIMLEDSIASYNKEEYFEPQWKKKNYVYKDVKISHKVRKNETWTSIARRYDVSVKDIKRWNGNKKYPIKGKLVTIYQKQKVEVEPKVEENSSPFEQETILKNEVVITNDSVDNSNEKNYTINDSTQTNIQTDSTSNNTKNISIKDSTTLKENSSTIKQDTQKINTPKKTKNNTSKSKTITHKVQKGETIFSISKKYGVDEKEIIKLNNLKGKNPIIKIGQKLLIR
ncbi:MAG: transglycosylase SLT domain-containing protein [Bacteroidales bacterium]|jgi:LysM repeat protein|nr:transglycosylase SLT domain-containing protein [Bacteroidales bacterium]